jgi:sigma-B regulation protein RsbU (phosphoserine phosphatase)
MNAEAGSTGVLFTLMAVTQLLLAGGGAYLYFRMQRARREAAQLHREKEIIFGFVHDIGEIFAEVEQMETDLLLKRVLFYAQRTTQAAAGAVYLFDPQQTQLQVRAMAGLFPPLMEKLDRRLDSGVSKSRHVEELVRTRRIARGEGLIGEVAESGAGLVIADAAADPRVPRHTLDFVSIHTLLLVPLRIHRGVLGVLALANRTSGEPFSDTDRNLIQALADQAAAAVHYAGLRDALDEKRRIDNDLSVARQIQASLLPATLPHLPSVELAAFNEPAQHVGGDYYDVIRVDDRHIGLAIADVSGKGIGGALLMSVCRSMLRAHAPGQCSPAAVLRQISRVMSADIAEEMFVTMLYMVLDVESRTLTVARAGHERPALIRRGEIQFLNSSGAAIGLMDDDTFSSALDETTVQLEPGDVVVAYTDGITEAMNARDEEWGLNAFLDACKVAAAEGAAPLVQNVRQRLQRFVGGRAQYDDMTLIVMRQLG